MGMLLEDFTEIVKYKGKKYYVDTAYDTIMLMQCLYEEEHLDYAIKIAQALKLLVKSRFRVWLLSAQDKLGLLEEIMKTKIEIEQKSQRTNGPKLIDFQCDGAYLYASFKQAYKIDLFQEKGRLQWKQFMALLDGLPENTKMKEVMRIRGMEIPTATSYNGKEIQNILELKAYYALPVKGKEAQKNLNTLFSTLERMVKCDE